MWKDGKNCLRNIGHGISRTVLCPTHLFKFVREYIWNWFTAYVNLSVLLHSLFFLDFYLRERFRVEHAKRKFLFL